MNTLCKSYIFEFIKIFIVLSISMSILLSLIGLIERIDDFIPYSPKFEFFFKYLLLNTPKYLFYLIPFITLISSLFIFSVGMKRKEFLILSVSGGRLRQILTPFLFVGLAITLFGFIVGEFIQPKFNKKINILTEELIQKKKATVQKNIYFKTREENIFRIETFYPEQKRGINVKIFIFKNGKLIKKLEAAEAEIREKSWILKDAVIYDFLNGKVEKQKILNHPLSEKISISVFKEIKKIEEFGVIELIEKRKELKKTGLSNPKIDADISGRLSYNLVTFFMMILGISLPLGATEKIFLVTAKSKEGIITAAVGLLITVIYWILYSLFMFMGYSKIIPPFVSPWIVPLIFSFVSLKLYLSIKE
ncbi:MAG: LptF/LptG family permease [Thermodesulfovibrio sp.]|nr:LptF/LptG family permease [Thermodesulfovibrio sp.]